MIIVTLIGAVAFISKKNEIPWIRGGWRAYFVEEPSVLLNTNSTFTVKQ